MPHPSAHLPALRRILPAVTAGCLAALMFVAGPPAGCSRDAGRRGGADGREKVPYARLQDDVEAVLARRWGGAAGARLDDQGGRSWPLAGAEAEGAVRCRVIRLGAGATGAAPIAGLAADLARVGAGVLWQESLGHGAWRLDVGAPGRATHTLALVPAASAASVQWSDVPPAAPWSALSSGSGPVVALVIDDWGQSLGAAAQAILDLPVPLTLAVLPGLPRSREVAALATPLVLPPDGEARKAAGSTDADRRKRLAAGCPAALSLAPPAAPAARREIFLHLPMQPQGYPGTNPGEGALLIGMDEAEVARRLDVALAAVPGARGVNNHMGSAATADLPLMAVLMEQLHRRGLRFVDSLTTPHSVAYRAARDAGVPALRNRLFLDVDWQDQDAIAGKLEKLVDVARKRGRVVGICHPHPAIAAVLARELPRYQAAGVRFVTASELMALEASGAERALETADAR